MERRTRRPMTDARRPERRSNNPVTRLRILRKAPHQTPKAEYLASTPTRHILDTSDVGFGRTNRHAIHRQAHSLVVQCRLTHACRWRRKNALYYPCETSVVCPSQRSLLECVGWLQRIMRPRRLQSPEDIRSSKQ